MDRRVTFIGSFRIPDYDAWLAAIKAMSDFVAERVPRILAFHAYASDDRNEGTVVYVHPDAESLDQHLAVAADLIRSGTEMVSVTAIRLLGAPNRATVDGLRNSGIPVDVQPLVTGFQR